MKKKFSGKWKSSKQPRKQRKYRLNAPKHTLRKFLGCNLSKELRKKYGKRSIPLKKDDKVKVVRGQFKGRTGKIDRVNLKKTEVIVTGIEINKKEGSKASPPIKPSNLMITELNLRDKKREDSLMRKKTKEKEKTQENKGKED